MMNQLFWWPKLAYCTLRYFMSVLPVHRTDETDVVVFPELPFDCGRDVQTPDMGSGPVFHRRYRARIAASKLSAEQLMQQLFENPNTAVPREAALFTKNGNDTALRIGDELIVELPGPWSGPVRVIDACPRSFRLATLKDHLEAGQIEFRTSPYDNHLVFEIESWARSGDWLADLLYDKLYLLQEMQTYVWAHYCERVSALSGGQLVGSVDVRTVRSDWRPPTRLT